MADERFLSLCSDIFTFDSEEWKEVDIDISFHPYLIYLTMTQWLILSFVWLVTEGSLLTQVD